MNDSNYGVRSMSSSVWSSCSSSSASTEATAPAAVSPATSPTLPATLAARPRTPTTPLVHRRSPVPPALVLSHSPAPTPTPPLSAVTSTFSLSSSLASLDQDSASSDEGSSEDGLAMARRLPDSHRPDASSPRHELVLPTLLSSGYPSAQALYHRSIHSSRAVYRIVVVGPSEGGERARLIDSLSRDLGLAFDDFSPDSGLFGSWGRAKNPELDYDVWLGLCDQDPTSLHRLVSHSRSLHLPLAQQLSPSSPNLRPQDIYQLASSGTGRGPGGWIDCCLVLVGQGPVSSSLALARYLAPHVPTLLVAVDSSSFSSASLESAIGTQDDSDFVRPTPGSSSPLLLLAPVPFEPTSLVSSIAETPRPIDSPLASSSFFPPHRPAPQRPLHAFLASRDGATQLRELAAQGFMRTRAEWIASRSCIDDGHYLLPPPADVDQDKAASDSSPFDPLHLSNILATLRSSSSFTTWMACTALGGLVALSLAVLNAGGELWPGRRSHFSWSLPFRRLLLLF